MKGKSEVGALRMAMEEDPLIEAVKVVDRRELILQGYSILAADILRYQELDAKIRKAVNASTD